MRTKTLTAVCAALCGWAGVLVAQAMSTSSVAAPDQGTFRPSFTPAAMSAHVTNRYFPLPRNRRFEYAGVEDGHAVRQTVTILPRTILVAGAPSVAVRDTLFQNGRALEDTFDWYSQDASGNVWYMGEDARTLNNGHVVSIEGSWRAGVNGAHAGIIMESRPRVGDSYREEYYPRVAQDMARVISISARQSTPYGTFSGLVCTKEWSPIEPGAGAEQKCYAAGIGLVAERSLDGASTLLTLRSVVP